MTFEEAKKRPDYKFVLNGIENDIEDIRNNYMKSLYEYGDPERGIAILEIGYVDIEVNLMTYEQVGEHPGDKRPIINYFSCIKYGDNDNDWRSDDYVDHDNVNWESDNWAEQLERDMFEALNKYVVQKGYSYDHAN